MKYNTIENILPRVHEENLKEVLNGLSALIEDAVNFGTHLAKWDADIKREGDASLPPLLFFRNILELADAISILVKHSSVDTCKPLLRSLLENVLGLEYLLEKDTKKRSLSYIVWHTHKNLKISRKWDKSTIMGKRLNNELKNDKFLGKSGYNYFDKARLSAASNNSEELLALPQYLSTETEYQRTLRKKKNPHWYSLYNGPDNMQQLATRLNYPALYEVFYRGFSGNVHATNLLHDKLVPDSNGQLSIMQIRSPKDIQSVTQNALTFLLLIYMRYCEVRIPNKKKDFKAWYAHFQKGYMSLNHEKYITLKL